MSFFQGSGCLKAVWPENVRVGFLPMFGQTWPQNPSRSTGLVLQCRLHQKSAPQTNSKAMPWCQTNPARLPSLHRSVNSFRFLCFLHWFGLGPGGLREAPGCPGKAHGGLWGGFPGAPGPPGAQVKKLQNPYFRTLFFSKRLSGELPFPPGPQGQQWPSAPSPRT